MKTYALVGKSGTGKSYKAMTFARQKGIEYIIDDGLLISKSKKVGGYSAKREATRMTAVKRAIFHFDDHREEMISLLIDEKPKSLLIIGTSLKMVNQIRANLGIESFDEIHMIEDISTEDEILIAKTIREKEGKHVIPLPTVEVKNDFGGYVLDKLKIVFRLGRHDEEIEKTIVRPTFSSLGNYFISKKALAQIVHYSASRVRGVERVIRIETSSDGSFMDVDVHISMFRMDGMYDVLESIQKEVRRNLEDTTCMYVRKVNIHLKRVNFL